MVARILLLLLCSLAAAMLAQSSPSSASTEQRVALVIGNAAYKRSPLRNPANDARAIAGRLQRLGFTVIKREDLKAREIGPALREFRSKLSPGAVALFFYAGHGLQVKGVNYLPAVDAEIDTEEDVYTQSLDVSKVLEVMEEGKTRVNLVFLDACRNNPFTRKFRSAAGGLAKVDAASGTLISFATRPGSVAADGAGQNGLYTEFLLRHMDEEGVPIEQVLKRVGAGVKLASQGRQEPWSEGLIEGEFFFRAGGRPALAVAPAAPAASDPLALEIDYWNAVKDSKSANELKAYLEQYPNGRYAALARARIADIAPPAETPGSNALPVAAAVAPTRLMDLVPETEIPEGWKSRLGRGQPFRPCAECASIVLYCLGGKRDSFGGADIAAPNAQSDQTLADAVRKGGGTLVVYRNARSAFMDTLGGQTKCAVVRAN